MTHPASSLKPAIVSPLHDPHGELLARLPAITPDLKVLFERLYFNFTAATVAGQAGRIAALQADPFFHIDSQPAATPPGVHFTRAFGRAAALCPAEQVLHLCFLDRLAFALQTEHRAAFMTDIAALTPQDAPLIFQRSAAAWATHPANYLEIEGMVTRAGELLFGRSLDFAWCHLAIPAGLLRRLLPQVRRPDLSIEAEIVAQIAAEVRTLDVDWLAWEDPFILGRDYTGLRAEREASQAEAVKRFTYVAPMLAVLLEWATNGAGAQNRGAQ